MKIKIFFVATLAAIAGLSASGASAVLTGLSCASTPGAVANSVSPTACASGAGGNGSGAETTSVNALWGGPDQDLVYIGKYDKESGKEDQAGSLYELLVTGGSEDFGYGFSLTSETLEGSTIDFALFVKQGGVTDYAYYWSGLLLDINGFFNSFNVNEGDDYSHISGFVRLTGTPVPEPGTLALLGLGLLGLGIARRRRAN